MSTWHLAGSLVALRDAVNRHWPHRDKTSDGTIGDARHAGGGPGSPAWTASDHNPWLNDTVRAMDIDKDGIDAAWLAEQLRLAGLHGDPRMVGGGYVIYDERITSPDFSHWQPYHGKDPHTSHIHVTVTRNPAGYEYTGAWAFLDHVPGPALPQHEAPDYAAAAAEAGMQLSGHDATGSGENFRAEFGDAGPKVEQMQRELNDFAPAYSQLIEDGVYGPKTADVVEEFAHREAVDPATPPPPGDVDGLLGADGQNVGPRIARGFVRDGIRL